MSSAASIDQLTGIANRREFDRRLANAPRRAEYWLVSIDIGKLKVMNDTFGHKAGDELLQAVAGALPTLYEILAARRSSSEPP